MQISAVHYPLSIFPFRTKGSRHKREPFVLGSLIFMEPKRPLTMQCWEYDFLGAFESHVNGSYEIMRPQEVLTIYINNAVSCGHSQAA